MKGGHIVYLNGHDYSIGNMHYENVQNTFILMNIMVLINKYLHVQPNIFYRQYD